MVRKAVIPIAGLGTRMLPISAAVPKALLPLVDADGAGRSVLHVILAEAAAAGVEQACVVVSPGQQGPVAAYFDAVQASVPELTFVEQTTAGGFGEAVSLARGFVGPDPFMVLLGDHVRLPAAGTKPCAAQVAEAAEGFRGAAAVGVQLVGAAEVHLVGVCAGEPVVADHVYRCRQIVEKPDAATAETELTTPGLPDGKYLAHAGVYLFRPEIFACLAELTAQPGRSGEHGLTEAQQLLLARHPDDYYLMRIAGDVFDVGHPAGYAETFQAVRQAPM
jgi:UTP--glucose-1-phosphate uridylyltransferase